MRTLSAETSSWESSTNGFITCADCSPRAATYQVIGIVGDARGTTFDGNDSKSVYMALPESRMHEYPILIRTRPDAGGASESSR
jgi:hypothetical protein